MLAEVHLPADLLRFGFFFIDTPGVGSLITVNTATTREFLPEVDAAIFVTSFECPFTEGELDFFEEVRGHVQTVFVAINKADLVTPDQRDEVLAFVREKLGQRMGDTNLPVFAVSARDSLDAKLAGRGELPQSGLLALERTLVDFLRTQKARALLTRITDRVGSLLKEQQAEIEVAERALADPEQAALAEQQLRAKADQLRREQDNILALLRARVSSDLASRCDGELAAWCQDVHIALMDRVHTFLKTSDWLTLLAGAPELTAEICATSRERMRAWFADHERDFQRVIREIAAEYAECLDASTAEALKLGGVSLTISGDGLTQPGKSSDIINHVPLLHRETPSLRWSFRAQWCVHALPLRFVKDIVLRQCSENLEEQLAMYGDEIRSSVGLIAGDWVNGLREALAESLSAAVTHAIKILQGKPEPEERAAINNILLKLKALQNSIVDLQEEKNLEIEPAEGDAPTNYRAEEALRSDVLSTCVICSRIEDELFQFMSKRQYELSTNESEQLDHAERGGFCALHTWQYEAIASPQGICTAYPPVLISFSRQLHSLAQRTASSRSLVEAVMRLLVQPRTCSACQLISAIEQRKAMEIVALLTGIETLDRKNLPALCLPHLCSVLGVKPEENLARFLLLEQSRVMEALAEDMQRYALKHDAVRRQLATEGEGQAHKRGLSRLVGSRNVSKPWKEG
jgi:hypothetical protein